MDWTEEKYVKLYQRDTVTWIGWPWEGRCVLPLLLRKVDGAGLLAHGKMAPAAGIGLLIGVPVSVVEVALNAFLEDGTAVLTPAGVLLPKFLDAQEARKSDALRARESRERRRNDAKSEAAASHGVTRRHETSQPVTLQPSPAQPSPAPAQKRLRAEKPPAVPLAHQETIDRIWAAWKRVKGCAYTTAPRGADFKAVKELLAAGQTPEGIEAAWVRALTHAGFPTVSNVVELQQHFGKFVGPLRTGKPTANPDQDFPIGVLIASPV